MKVNSAYLFVVFILAGCLHGAGGITNVTPSSSKYPKDNLKSNWILDISVSHPSNINASLVARYTNKKNEGKCKYLVNSLSGTTANFWVDIPLDKRKKSDKAFSSRVIIDKYKEGECDWKFQAVSLHLEKNGIDNIPVVVARLWKPKKNDYAYERMKILYQEGLYSPKGPIELHCNVENARPNGYWSQSCLDTHKVTNIITRRIKKIEVRVFDSE